MIQSLEPPMHMDANAERLQLVGNNVFTIPLQGTRRDPIFELFNPPNEAG